MKKIFTLILSVTVTCLMFGQNQGDGVIACDESNEIIERRGLHEKHYLRSDGKIDMKVSSEPLHYRENNKWETIDSRITENTSNDFVGYEYANTKNSFKSYYSSDINKGFITSFKDGSVIQEFQDVKMYYMDAAENISDVESISSSSKFKLSDNAITHQDIFLSTDVNITQQNGKRKLDFVLKDVTAIGNAPSDAKFLVFEETTILPEGFNATLENQSIVIEDANGNFVAQYDAPIAYGSEEETLSNPPVENNNLGILEDNLVSKHSENIINEEHKTKNYVRYDIFQTVDNKLIIKTIVDMQWLTQNESSYPIVIDPTLSATRNVTGTGYTNYGGYGGYGPPGINTSGAPLNSQITNVNVSFNVAENSRWYNPPGWWTPTAWYSYSGNCGNYHYFGLFDNTNQGIATCGGSTNAFNCRNPNNTWYTEIFRTNWDVWARWGYTVNVTYSSFSNDFGLNEWKVYAYDGRNRDNLSATSYKGVYTRNTIGVNTYADYGNSAPDAASGWSGCGSPGNDYHTVVAKRKGFPCGTYSLEVANHDDEASLVVDGTVVWTANCCNNNGVKWTGVLDANSTVEMRYAEGVGGHGMILNVNNISSSLNAGIIAYGGANNACSGYNPPTIGSSTSASGGASAAINNGSTTYQWTLNGNNISGATGATYDPENLSQGNYEYRRVATDKCGNTATSNPITYTVAADVSVTNPSSSSVCEGTNVNFNVTASGGYTLTYTWQYFNGSTWVTAANGTPSGSTYAGLGSPSITVSGLTAAGAVSSYDYRVVVSSTGGACGPATSAAATATISTNPSAANAGEDKPACINNPATLSASNPPIGSGTWTWSPSAPTYAGGTSASDYNAQVVFNAVGQYTGTWTVTNGICASTFDDAVVTVTSADNNASLFTSAGAATESVPAYEVCEEGAWTYYAASGEPDEYLFAINKNGNTFDAEVTITDLPGTAPITSLGGQPLLRGTWLIGRYWNVSLSSGSISTTVDVRFFVDPAEVTQAHNEATAFLNSTTAATNITALTFFKTVSTVFDPATSLVNGEFTFAPAYLSYSTGTLNGVTYYELTGLTSFSGGTGGFTVNDNNASLLPVELLSFDVNAVDNRFIRLDWATASEINNEGFEVLRSTDGVNFERIAWISGNGNSTEINEYVFNDRGVDKGMTYYYQLKQIDYDGQYEYFDIKSARLEGKTTFTVGALIPNPSKGSEMVSVDIQTVSGDVLTVEIYDRIGAKVKSASYVLFAAENALDINISDLAAGTYFLKFDSSMGTETKKLVVVK